MYEILCILRRQPLLSGCLLIFDPCSNIIKYKFFTSVVNIRNRFSILNKLSINILTHLSMYFCVCQNNIMNKYDELRLTSLITYFAIGIKSHHYQDTDYHIWMTSPVIFAILLYLNLNDLVRKSNSVDLLNHYAKRKKLQKHFQYFSSLLVFIF